MRGRSLAVCRRDLWRVVANRGRLGGPRYPCGARGRVDCDWRWREALQVAQVCDALNYRPRCEPGHGKVASSKIDGGIRLWPCHG